MASDCFSDGFPSDIADLLEEAENLPEKNEKEMPMTPVSLFTGIKRAVKQMSISQFFQSKRPLPQATSSDTEPDSRFKESKSKSKIVKAITAVTPIKVPIANKLPKRVPSFKWIPDSPFVVDAFNYGIIPGATAYFLTHFHSDHYQGLSGKMISAAPDTVKIFCSPVTANLIVKELRVPQERIIRLQRGDLYDLNAEWQIGVVDANHCPGSVMFIFHDRRRSRWHLHTGDFRFHRPMLEESFGDGIKVRDVAFDHVFLDTTYARPNYAFPSQDEVIAACIAGVQELLASSPKKKWLIACGSYLIGKERIALAVAEFFNLRIYADTRKRSILNALEWPELQRRLTDDPLKGQLHIVSMAVLGKKKLTDYREQYGHHYTHIIGIRPTGWTHTDNGNSGSPPLSIPMSKDSSIVWPLPYSEHSSYAELGTFLRSVVCRRIVPTVDNWQSISHDCAQCSFNSDLMLQRISKK